MKRLNALKLYPTFPIHFHLSSWNENWTSKLRYYYRFKPQNPSPFYPLFLQHCPPSFLTPSPTIQLSSHSSFKSSIIKEWNQMEVKLKSVWITIPLHISHFSIHLIVCVVYPQQLTLFTLSLSSFDLRRRGTTPNCHDEKLFNFEPSPTSLPSTLPFNSFPSLSLSWFLIERKLYHPNDEGERAKIKRFLGSDSLGPRVLALTAIRRGKRIGSLSFLFHSWLILITFTFKLFFSHQYHLSLLLLCLLLTTTIIFMVTLIKKL